MAHIHNAQTHNNTNKQEQENSNYCARNFGWDVQHPTNPTARSPIFSRGDDGIESKIMMNGQPIVSMALGQPSVLCTS
jgi:hypothetical protein